MSTICKEQLLPLSELPNHLPRKKGKRIHLATLYRWIGRGVAGVQLEAYWVGGMRCSSIEACDRFNAAVTAAKELKRLQSVDDIDELCSEADELAKAGW